MVSPNRGSTTNLKRKTILGEDGKRRVVQNLPSSPGSPALADRSPTSAEKSRRRRQLKKGDGDIFGDFFGFGPNPAGCLSKGAEPINVKAEKDKFGQLITAEAKRYDVNSMKTNLNTKIDQIVKGIKKDQRIIMNDEERQLRNLDKLSYMQEYLIEDNTTTKAYLQSAQEIKDESKKEMQVFNTKNKSELQDFEA